MCAAKIIYCYCLILSAFSTSPITSLTHPKRVHLSSQPFFFIDRPFKMSSVMACCHRSSHLSQNTASLSHVSITCNICKMWLNWMKDGQNKKMTAYTFGRTITEQLEYILSTTKIKKVKLHTDNKSRIKPKYLQKCSVT